MERSEKNQLLAQIRSDAERIAAEFGLRYRAIQAEHPRVKSRYGACYSDGLITIRLKHAKTGQPLKYSSLIDTLCHELAHLRHFNHSPKFKAFFLQLLSWARREGIYRPGPESEVPSFAPYLPSQQEMALALRPPQRNGVPVFPQLPAANTTDAAEWLPWERRAAGLSSRPPRRPDAIMDRPSQPAERPRPGTQAEPKQPAAPRQLTLW